MLKVVAAFVFATIAGMPWSIEAKADWLGCKTFTDDKLRLVCYDAAANAASNSNPSADMGADIAAKEPTDSATPTVYETVDPDDIWVGPKKYVGKAIEFKNVSCLYADTTDYRCATSALVTVFGGTVTPDSAKLALETSCKTMKSLATKPCRKTIRFVVGDYSQDELSGNQKRIILIAKSIEIVDAQPKKKR